jgi:hypothetical protein
MCWVVRLIRVLPVIFHSDTAINWGLLCICSNDSKFGRLCSGFVYKCLQNPVCFSFCYVLVSNFKIRTPVIIRRNIVYCALFGGSITRKAFGMLCYCWQEPFGLVLSSSVTTISSQILIKSLIHIWKCLGKSNVIPIQAMEALRVARGWGSHIF